MKKTTIGHKNENVSDKSANAMHLKTCLLFRMNLKQYRIKIKDRLFCGCLRKREEAYGIYMA